MENFILLKIVSRYKILFQNTIEHFIFVLGTLIIDFEAKFLGKRGCEILILLKKRKTCRFLATLGKFAALWGAPGAVEIST